MPAIAKQPGETLDQFVARIAAGFKPPSDEAMQQLRRLLPPSRALRADLPQRRSA